MNDLPTQGLTPHTAPVIDFTVTDELRTHVLSSGDTPALAAPGRRALTYRELWAQVEHVGRLLAGRGIRAGDAVAVAMPEGPEAFVMLLAVMRQAVCVPLNPAWSEAEFETALTRVRARLLITLHGAAPDAGRSARGIGLPVYEVSSSDHTAGLSLNGGVAGELRAQDAPCYASGTALLLFTSATTERPKLVPLSHPQLSAMISLMRTTFPSADAGRVLMITPHFHLQCILSALIQLFSGGIVISTPGFQLDHFRDWMHEFRPTQFTANPTLFRAIFDCCPDRRVPRDFSSLRFVTCAGAPLSTELREEIERRLGVPLVEGYGLTESGRVTMTPLDSAQRRPGSVGRCCGPEVRIMDMDGNSVATGQIGEVVLRGETVIRGYAHDPQANVTSFRNGWFRTGDLGRLDADGFLYLVGRIKEAINRGAEKILPYHIEAVLARHPAVREVVVFGYPHPRLGEDLGACIVLRSTATAAELRRFAALHLAGYEIPRSMMFVDEIPKGPTGKPQRAELAEKLNIVQAMPQENRAGESALDEWETRLAAIWTELLGVEGLGRGDDFFLLGGDSLLAVHMLLQIEREWGCEIPVGTLAASATLGDVAATVRRARARPDPSQPSCLVVLQPQGILPPLWVVHPMKGRLLAYRQLIQHLGNERPVVGFEAAGLRSGERADLSLQAMAESYLQELQSWQGEGPYWLAGYSMGGLIALEMARQLLADGKPVGGVVLIDTYCQHTTYRSQLHRHIKAVSALPWSKRCRYVYDETIAWVGRRKARAHRVLRRMRPEASLGGSHVKTGTHYEDALTEAMSAYRIRPLAVHALLLWCSTDDANGMRPAMLRRWQRLISGALTIREVPGRHGNVTREPHVRQVAAEISRFLSRLEEGSNS